MHVLIHASITIRLGLNGVAVKSRRGTDAVGFAHALQMAYHMIKVSE